MKKQRAIAIRKEEWYNALIEDLKAIFTEKMFRARDEVLEMKWMIGDRILQEEKQGITEVVKCTAFDTGFSERELWRCLEFRKEYPGAIYQKAISKKPLPEGKNCSWHKMANQYLPSASTGTVCQKHKWKRTMYWRCENCGKKLFSNPNVQD